MQQLQQYNEITSSNWDLTGSGKNAWVVYLRGTCVDIVWFKSGLTAREVKQALVYQDGYSVDIVLQRPS